MVLFGPLQELNGGGGSSANGRGDGGGGGDQGSLGFIVVRYVAERVGVRISEGRGSVGEEEEGASSMIGNVRSERAKGADIGAEMEVKGERVGVGERWSRSSCRQ